MRIAAPLMLAFLAGCGGQSSDGGPYATTWEFYFTVNCPNPGQNCQEAKRLLDTEIPRYKYTFTYGSSRAWPYYAAFDLDENVPRDSLLPPHSQLHQLIPKEDKPIFGGSDYLVVIDLYTKSDTIPDYIVNVYRNDASPPQLSGSSGLQLAVQRPGMNLSMPEILLKSVIRFTFK